jgi:uncharacterized protein (TIGR02145 family)
MHYGREKAQFCDERDGQKYVYVTINAQTWMAENLNFNAPGSVCYGNNPSNCTTYGRLYTWNAAMSGAISSNAVPSGRQGVCPAGWHFPSDAEWTVLMNHAGSRAHRLRASSGWYSNNGIDEFGFSALPGGTGNSNDDNNFWGVDSRGLWWSATEENSALAHYLHTYGSYATVFRECYHKWLLHSVRCVRD